MLNDIAKVRYGKNGYIFIDDWQAVVELDRSRILAMIEQIAKQDISIGRAFRALAKKLDYGRLLSLLKYNDVNDRRKR